MNRRAFLTATAALATAPAFAQQQLAGLRGTLDVGEHGVRPDLSTDQGRVIQKLLDQASDEDRPVFLPPGRYVVSNIDLPVRTRLLGLSGTATLVFGGGGSFITATGCEVVDIDGVTFDGANRLLDDPFAGLIHARACPRVRIENCSFIGSQAVGLSLEKCGGDVSANRISGAAGLAALYSVEASGMTIRDNTVTDCANGGILVHRWNAGRDDTIISGNRISRIRATEGGTGQHGNGVNLFRAHGCIVSGNHISDCAFSAIRGNSASNALISGNSCFNSGETGIYAEFAFEGSVVDGNIVDGATIGISIANFDKGGRMVVCSDNLVRNLKTDGPYPAEVAGFGIGIFAEADTIVSGNVVEGAPQYGIGMGWGPYLRNVMARGNILRDCGDGISVTVAEGAGPAVISDNIIARPARDAIIGKRWLERASGDLAQHGGEQFPHLTIRDNTVTTA